MQEFYFFLAQKEFENLITFVFQIIFYLKIHHNNIFFNFLILAYQNNSKTLKNNFKQKNTNFTQTLLERNTKRNEVIVAVIFFFPFTFIFTFFSRNNRKMNLQIFKTCIVTTNISTPSKIGGKLKWIVFYTITTSIQLKWACKE